MRSGIEPKHVYSIYIPLHIRRLLKKRLQCEVNFENVLKDIKLT